MATCNQVRPMLYRAAEGETSPEEAMLVARHLPGCTACKILLAREHRLAELLERDLRDLPLDENFVDGVMSTLPRGPISSRRAAADSDAPESNEVASRRGRRRGIKLAGIFIAVGSAISALAFNFSGSVTLPATVMPRADLATAQGGLEGLLGLAGFAVLAVETLATRLQFFVSSPSLGVELIGGLVIASAAGLAAASTLLAVAAGYLVSPGLQR